MSEKSSDILTGMKEICQHLGVSECTALKWFYALELPIKKVGGIWVSSRKKLDNWARKQCDDNK